MVEIADVVIPGGLPPADAAEALPLLQHVKHTAVRLDAEIQSAGSLPASIPNRGFPARTQAKILFEGLQWLDAQGSILPPEFVPRWIEETNARLHAIGVCEPIDESPTPPVPPDYDRLTHVFEPRRPVGDGSPQALVAYRDELW